MSNRALKELRGAVSEIFDNALSCVDACAAVRRAVSLDGANLRIAGRQLDTASRPIYLVAIGKASFPMAQGMFDVLGRLITGGVITGPITEPQENSVSKVCQVFNGGHPLPNEQSLAAAQATFQLLREADLRQAIVVFLISGGGSAAIEWPRHRAISLHDLQQGNQALVSSGATIKEINSVRRAFSAIKGGGLARLAPATTQINLIISDVNPGEEAVVASGPSIISSNVGSDPGQIVARYRIRLPEAIERAINDFSRSLNPVVELDQTNHVLLDNGVALRATAEKARSLGFTVEVATDIVEEPIESGCQLLFERFSESRRRSGGPFCLLSGGEFSCPVRGRGVGGRNLETVLRWALELDRLTENGVVLSCGSDGIDGNSPAAGAIADQTTLVRARAVSLDASVFLANSDAFPFFQSLGDAIITGPTGTNVRDVRILASN